MNIKPKFLLVEDNPDDVLLAKEAVEISELQVVLECVPSGEDCVERLTDENTPLPDVVLLDLRMPGMSDFAVLEELSKHSRLSRLPVLVMSSSESPEDIRRAYDLGCKSYIPKPVNFGKFIDIMKSLHHYWLETVILAKP